MEWHWTKLKSILILLLSLCSVLLFLFPIPFFHLFISFHLFLYFSSPVLIYTLLISFLFIFIIFFRFLSSTALRFIFFCILFPFHFSSLSSSLSLSLFFIFLFFAYIVPQASYPPPTPFPPFLYFLLCHLSLLANFSNFSFSFVLFFSVNFALPSIPLPSRPHSSTLIFFPPQTSLIWFHSLTEQTEVKALVLGLGFLFSDSFGSCINVSIIFTVELAGFP